MPYPIPPKSELHPGPRRTGALGDLLFSECESEYLVTCQFKSREFQHLDIVLITNKWVLHALWLSKPETS